MGTEDNYTSMNVKALSAAVTALGGNPTGKTRRQLIGFLEQAHKQHEAEGRGVPDGRGAQSNEGEAAGKAQPQEEEQDSDGRMMKESRKNLASFKQTPDNPDRQTVSSEGIRRLVDETMGDSDKLANAVMTVIRKHKDKVSEALDLPSEFKTLAEKMLVDIENAWTKEHRSVTEQLRVIAERSTRKLVIEAPEMPEQVITDPHYRFEDLLFNAVMRLPTMLVGPSGSGKSTAARHLGDVMGLPFGYVSMGPTQTEHTFSGYTDAQGFFVPKEFYLRYRYGGVLLIDEIDASEPSTLLWTNAAIQNKLAAFPRGIMNQLERVQFHREAKEFEEAGGMVPMHPDCVIVASANTFGRGADMLYVGRRPLDASTLKRYKVIYWDYDERLERKLAQFDAWVDVVQRARTVVDELGIHHVVSPVDSIDGARMLLAGKDPLKVLDETVLAGLPKHDKDQVQPKLEEAFKGLLVALKGALAAGQEKAHAAA